MLYEVFVKEANIIYAVLQILWWTVDLVQYYLVMTCCSLIERGGRCKLCSFNRINCQLREREGRGIFISVQFHNKS